MACSRIGGVLIHISARGYGYIYRIAGISVALYVSYGIAAIQQSIYFIRVGYFFVYAVDLYRAL